MNDAERDDDEEDHRHAVHGEELVVEVGRVQLLAGRRELEADEHGLDAAEEKKNSAEAPYMMPMRLWSTVVNQLFHPVVACGR